VLLGVVGTVGAALMPTSASPGDGREPATQFHPKGDGSLPSEAPRLRAPDEPLSSAERGYAIHIARTGMPPGARDVLGNPGGEVLLADLPPLSERTSSRQVGLAIYDYTSDRLHQVVVDLTRQTMVSSRSVRGLQLPPTEAETTVALDLAMTADPAPAFLAEYRAIVGTPLLSAEQVHAVAGVWRAVPGRGAPVQPTTACRQHRCLQLLVALPSGQYLSTQDFAVDLSSRRVLPAGPPQGEHSHDE
jgi:hypothetical protein